MTEMLGISDKDQHSYGKLREIFQSVFMIHKVILVHHETSLPVFEKDLVGNVSLESSLITSILQAISSIGQEMIGIPTGFRKLEFHGFVVTGAYHNGFSVYAFSETELIEEIRDGLNDLIEWFSNMFCSLRDDWNGSLDVFKMSREIINTKISQNLFLWLLYPLKPSKNPTLNREKLSTIGKYILKCIETNINCSTARVLDEFNEHDEETVLIEIFNLVVEGFIETSSNDSY